MIVLPDDVEALARELAARHGTSLEDAVKRAVEDSARAAGVQIGIARARDRSPQAIAARKACADRIADEITALPLLDTRTAREIMDDIDSP